MNASRRSVSTVKSKSTVHPLTNPYPVSLPVSGREIPNGWIHSLRAHRHKTNVNKSENWHSTPGFKHQRADDLATVHTLYTVIVMILLMAIWGAWSRKDSSL